MPATQITVTATYKKLNGDAASGTVSFELSGTLIDQSGDVLYPSLKRVAQLDSDGALSVVLPATKGDVTTSPTGLTYTVREAISPGAEHSYPIELDTANGLTQDLSDIAPATNVVTNTYALVSALTSHEAASQNVHGIADTAQLATLADVAANVPEWGNVSGTLSAQTDLATALATKASPAADETISGTWDFSAGQLAVPQTAGRPTTSPPAGTLAYDPAAHILWLRGADGWYTTTLALAWLDGWSYARPVMVTNEGSTTLTNYQTKISLTSANMSFANAKSDGSDLRITLADGTTLVDHYVTSWDNSGQAATVWAKIPSLPAGGTTLYLYYGNAGATSTAKTFDQFFSKFATDANTLALWHCDDGTGTTAADATGSYPLTLTNVTWGSGDGGGQDTTQNHFASGSYLVFNGTNAKATVTGLFDTPPTEFTIEGWTRLDATPSSKQIIWSKQTISAPTNSTSYFNFHITAAGALGVDWNIKSSTGAQVTDSTALSWTVGTWYHVAMTFGNGGIRVYRNGTLVATLAYTAALPAGTALAFMVGTNPLGTGAWFHGAVDELRILTIESTPAEIVNDMQRSTRFTAPTDQPSKFIHYGTVLNPTGWESSIAAEPTVVYHDDTFHMFYVGGGTGASTNIAIGHATSTDGQTWTRHGTGPVLGQGTGETTAQHAYCFHDGTQFVLFYANTTEAVNSGSGACVATSPDGDTWTPYANNPVMPMVTSTWETTYGNSYVFQYAGTWYNLYTAADGSGTWRSGLATAPAYLGPWTKYSGNPLSWSGLGATMPALGHIGVYRDSAGLWHGWWHAAISSSLPYAILHGTSPDLITWTPDSTAMAPIQANETFGLRDPVVLEVNGSVYLWDSQGGTGATRIGLSTFAGTLAELVTDLSAPAATVGPAQAR